MRKQSVVLISFTLSCLLGIFSGCTGSSGDSTTSEGELGSDSKTSSSSGMQSQEVNEIDQKRQRVKLGHAINTSANEYLPVMSSDGGELFFSAMDRTGFFDFKLDYTKVKSAGGEDIFMSELKEGVWADARPITEINTNGHEVVSQVLGNGDLLATANYPENLGVQNNTNAAVQTTDLFFLKKTNSGYQISHLPEPVNSIFTEADGWMAEDQSFILFVSDGPGHVGEYHKKGWKWNDSFWGNTDVYVSTMEGDNWSVPVNLGPIVNTPFAERTPWLSKDGLTLYISSNGFVEGKTDLDVYAFKRKNTADWTTWSGPFAIADANTLNDDWGYKETSNGMAYLASSEKLNYKPTQRGSAGDAGFRETNFRTGYEVFGLQVAGLNAEYETNIYSLIAPESPSFTINDVFFDLNSYKINKGFEKYLLLLVDQINQNNKATIEIHGHTDNSGEKKYNKELSLKRAEAIKDFLMSNGVKNTLTVKGFGDEKPIYPNENKALKGRNRRVEIYLKQNIDG
jgi:outer membrane protein OmpA-like peptidoglycan-associated protein